MLVASGVEWRRLDVPGLDALLGAGVYYGAGPSEAVSCRGCRVAVVGGGNSAGQAVVRFSRYAARVTLLVRGRVLGDSMSKYLVTADQRMENVEIRTSTEVDRPRGGHTASRPVITSRSDATSDPSGAGSLFICIGGVPTDPRTRRTQTGRRRRWLSADRRRKCTPRPPARERMAAFTPTLATRNQPTRLVRRGRRAQRIDQTLLRCDRRRIDGRRVGPSAPCRSSVATDMSATLRHGRSEPRSHQRSQSPRQSPSSHSSPPTPESTRRRCRARGEWDHVPARRLG